MNCNLSPQGDGNVTTADEEARKRIATYPRKGTVTQAKALKVAALGIATYPRKGTVTTFQVDIIIPRNCNLSPQGDGNVLQKFAFAMSALQLIPARGR